jgi:predicted O-methyltransferase YrrM
LRRTSFWKVAYISYFSKPSSERLIYRTMRSQQPRRILELGLGLGRRALRLIDVAARYVPRQEIQYIAIDPFEDRPAGGGQGLSLIDAHRLLKSSGARVKLIPGDPWEVLVRSANHLGPVDLLIFSADDRRAEQYPEFWFYVPRLLHEKSAVFRESAAVEGQKLIQRIGRQDILAWAAAAPRRRAA